MPPVAGARRARRGAGLRFGLGRRFGAGTAAARSADAARRRGRTGAARRARHRGAAAGAAQPGAAGAPGRDAGPGVGGALHPGRRHRARRAEHPRRVRRLRRAVREARRAHDGRAAAVPRAVERRAGGLGRALAGERRRAWRRCRIGPAVHRSGSAATRRRAWSAWASWFDGWFPNAPDAAQFAAQWAEVQRDRPCRGPRSVAAVGRDVPDADGR